MEDLVYGFDFGTSNSAVAVLKSDGKSEVLRIGDNGGATIRSVLFFPYVPEKVKLHFVGEEAIAAYISSGMQGRFLQSVKSILPNELFSDTLIQGDYLTLEDLIFRILKHIKDRADNLVQAEVKKVVLGRPAKFSDEDSADNIAEQRLLIAAQRAGFTDVKFQLEPIAAALNYESSLVDGGEKVVFVADLGGGTSDFTIMKIGSDKIHKSDRREDVLSSGGIYLGGDSFDSDIMQNKLVDHFGRNSHFHSYGKLLPFPTSLTLGLSRWQEIGLMKKRGVQQSLSSLLHSSDNPEAIKRLQALINKDLGFSLFSSIERAKVSLSSAEMTEIIFDHPDVNIRQNLARKEFEKFTKEKAEKIAGTVDEVVRQASLTPQQVDAVFITGGTSLIPSIRKIFTGRFGGQKLVSSDSFTSVVSGLALSTRLLF